MALFNGLLTSNVQLKEKGETIKRLEQGKVARMKRTMRLVGELPDSYHGHSRREKELLFEADAFAADFKVATYASPEYLPSLQTAIF